ncbi:MAG: class II aldolase/adducin family protein [Dehalococcoidia bacterium]|nr:MAG: class II aldolase/adducin family protein [Dehalococcoidia bacterium]
MKNGMSKWNSEKKAVLEAAQQMANMGLVVGTSGNVSMRLGEHSGRELLAITPNARYYDTLDVDDIVVADFEGENVEGELAISIERMLHIGIYKARKKVNAIIHTHPVFGSAISVSTLEIPAFLDDQVTYIGGEIKVAEYALPGTQDLVDNVISALGPRNAVLLANHGAVSVGRDMREAFTICELAEKTAKIYVCALSLGRINPLPAEAAKVEKAFFNFIHGDSQ